MEHLAHQLKALSPTIVEICRLSGTLGVSLGVLHNFRYRDVEGKIPPDDNTLYYLASLSKAFTAACIGILVDEQKLKWDTPVSRILPDFVHPDPTIRDKVGMLDFLSYRTGLASKNQMWLTEMGHLSLSRNETVRFSSYLEAVHAFQSRWLYNNWEYGLADEVTEKLSGKS